MPPKKDSARARWVEIGVSVALSIITSAVAVSWTASSTLTGFTAKLEEQDRRLAALESATKQTQTENSAQGALLAVQESRWSEIVRRLDSIDRKLEQR